MSQTTYDTFLPEVLPYLPGCPEISAINAVRNACIEFCTKSLWLTYTPPGITMVGGQATYNFTTPANTECARVLEAWYNSYKLVVVGEEQIADLYNVDYRTTSSSPMFYTSLTPDTVQMIPGPDGSVPGTLSLILAIQPTRASTDVDTTIYERWAEVIANGAKARLSMIPDQPFYNPQSGGVAMSLFQAGISAATRDRLRGRQRATLYVRPPKFF